MRHFKARVDWRRSPPRVLIEDAALDVASSAATTSRRSPRLRSVVQSRLTTYERARARAAHAYSPGSRAMDEHGPHRSRARRRLRARARVPRSHRTSSRPASCGSTSGCDSRSPTGRAGCDVRAIRPRAWSWWAGSSTTTRVPGASISTVTWRPPRTRYLRTVRLGWAQVVRDQLSVGRASRRAAPTRRLARLTHALPDLRVMLWGVVGAPSTRRLPERRSPGCQVRSRHIVKPVERVGLTG